MKRKEEKMPPKVFKKEAEVPWTPHDRVKNAQLKLLYTKEKDGSPITVVIVHLEKGVTLPDHRHPEQPDLIYPLRGKATMFIEGEPEFPLEPGMVVQVPVNVLHAIRNVEEDFYMYNVWAPASR
jgi:quercetin dioxygenase-like cupin family protein